MATSDVICVIKLFSSVCIDSIVQQKTEKDCKKFSEPKISQLTVAVILLLNSCATAIFITRDRQGLHITILLRHYRNSGNSDVSAFDYGLEACP